MTTLEEQANADDARKAAKPIGGIPEGAGGVPNYYTLQRQYAGSGYPVSAPAAAPTPAAPLVPNEGPPVKTYPAALTRAMDAVRNSPYTPPLPPPLSSYQQGQAVNNAVGSGINALVENSPITQLSRATNNALNEPQPFLRGLVGLPPASAAAPVVHTAAPAAATPVMNQPPASLAGPGTTPTPGVPVAATAYSQYAPQTTAPAWTGGGATATGQRTLPSGISMIRGADGVPIFTNVPANTRADLLANNGHLPMTADQSLTFPGVSSLVRGANGYTGGTIGVPGSNPSSNAPAQAGGVYDRLDRANAAIEEARQNAQSDIKSFLTNDPRSPLGALHRSIQMDASFSRSGGRYGGGPPSEGQALEASIVNQLGGQGHSAEESASREGGLAKDVLTQSSENQRELYRQNNQNQRESNELKRRGITTDEEGNYGYPDANDKFKYITDAQGNKIKAQKSAKDIGGIGKLVEQGVLSPEEARAHLGMGQQNASPPTEEDVKLLKGNPSLKDKFDAIHGKGAADRILGS